MAPQWSKYTHIKGIKTKYSCIEKNMSSACSCSTTQFSYTYVYDPFSLAKEMVKHSIGMNGTLTLNGSGQKQRE
jgi:hypothetical protein